MRLVSKICVPFKMTQITNKNKIAETFPINKRVKLCIAEFN